ncbi:MAG: hypothetical protein IKE55_11325 [Kiritimatiellae bacterium]|nr:hypothetical protein [Kiritimatiellia bacterium]
MKKRLLLLVAAVGVSIAAVGEPVHSCLARQVRKTCMKDFTPERADGRTTKTLAWARKKLADAAKPPAHPFLKDRESFLAWRKDYLKRHYAGYLPWKPKEPAVELVSKEKRDGYSLHVYECHPYPRAAVRAWVLVPDGAKPGKTPVVFCLPGSGASLEGLVGDKDPYFTRYPIRNRQAWWYVKSGMIAVALENIGTANGAADDMPWWASRVRLADLVRQLDSSITELVTRQVAILVDFLKEHPLVDKSKIAVSGMSLGAMEGLYPALLIPEVTALVYNDFACDGMARRLSTTDLPSGSNSGGGSNVEALMAMAPKYMILNEGGAWKGVIEDIKRAYELSGHPENLTIHYYDKYADPAARKYDNVDVRTLSGLDASGFLEVCNCHEYDHSFHAESALPWLRGLFFGTPDVPKGLEAEVARARAERERKPEELYPPDGLTGRKCCGKVRPFTEADYVSDRPDGRSTKGYAWAMLEIRDRLRARHDELREKFKRLDVRKRDGYTVETWEFYPDDILAVKTMFLIPDNVTPFVTPVTVCVAANEASVEGLSGEEDPYCVECTPLALNAVRKGEIAVALALPGCANGCPDDLNAADSRRRYAYLLQDTGWTDAKLVELEKRMCQDFLKGRTDFSN